MKLKVFGKLWNNIQLGVPGLLASTVLLAAGWPPSAWADLAVSIDAPAGGALVKNLSCKGSVSGYDGTLLPQLYVVGHVRRDADGLWYQSGSWGPNPSDIGVNPTYLYWANPPSGNYYQDQRWAYVTWDSGALVPNGTNLLDGHYTLVAHAEQTIGSQADTSIPVQLDTTKPVATLTSVNDGDALAAFPFLTGAALDPPGLDAAGSPAVASGIKTVTLNIKRIGDYYGNSNWWGGTEWGYLAYLNPPVNQNAHTWSYALPFGAAPNDARYEISVYAMDNVGNLGTNFVVRFTVDTTPPYPPVFGFPGPGATVPGLPRISGTASDNLNGSGIGRVYATLQRLSDNQFWDGAGWTTETFFPATFSYVPTPIGFAPRVGWSVEGGWPTGANLPDGAYRARAYAYDLTGNNSVSTNNFIVNKQRPSVDFTSPPNLSAYNAFPSIYGTAQAAPGLSIARVDLYIYKESWLAYWDGSMWDDQSTTVFHTTMTGPTNWVYTGSLPSGTNALDDTYSLIAYAYDNASNSSALVYYFFIDTTNPPPPTIDTPADGSALTALSFIQGTGVDNPGGSGFNGVLLFLSRTSDGKYWNGSAWDAFSFASILGASWAGTNWLRSFGLPSGADLPEGGYSIVARSQDLAGNLSDIRSNYFTIDLTPPTLSFVAPRDTAPITSLPFVKTTASDPGGSGIDHVDLVLQRESDAFYWDGAVWTSAFATLTTTGQQATNWSRFGALPAGNDLAEGQYLLTADAYDRAGNLATISRTITVKSWPPGCTGLASNFVQVANLPILDFTTNTSTIIVSNLASYLWDVNVTTFITHTYNSDLTISLTSPAGTTTPLSVRKGGSYDNVFNGTVWDDQAGLAVSEATFADNVVQPRLVPEGALGAFIGQNPNGVWTLTVIDSALGDTGQLNSWSLALTTLAAPPESSLATFTNSTLDAMPDLSTNAFSLSISGAGLSINHLALTTAIRHTFNSDLSFTLTSPAGTVTTIAAHNGGGNSNVFNGTLWDDDAVTPVTQALFTNGVTRTPLVPVGALAAFNGENPNGLWVLTVADSVPGDSGSLNGWSLAVTTCDCRPVLSISRAGGSIVLTWQASALGFVLESTPSLIAPSWSGVAQTPTLANGLNAVTLPADSLGHFYRLRK